MAHTLADELPPHYTDFSTELPLTFRIGSEQVSPLVNVTELQAHLRLLRAFKKLQEDVHDAHTSTPEKGGVDGLPTDKDRAWVVFVNRAVYRFDKFMSGKWTDWPAWSEECIVPLDVIMVWHTFLLNPRAYHEDSIRRTTPFSRRLIEMESMPLTLIASLIDPTTFEPLLPSARREAFFEGTSGLPYMYTLTTSTSDVVSIPCPCCNTVNPTVKWITPEGNVGGNGTGFAEPSFVHECEGCGKKFTRGSMGIRKFAEEFTRKRAGRKVYFPETLLQPMTGKPDPMIADMLIVRLLRRLNAVFKFRGSVEAEDITKEAISLGERLFWSPDELTVYLHQGLQPQKAYNAQDTLPRLQRIMAAYNIPGYASIDLVAAVLRQGSFIERMNGLGWLDESRFQSVHNQALLRRAIARYHAFLDLMSANPSSFYVPTLDIDLVWHTHQLSATAYRAETLRLLERTPNHDDTVQPITIQSAYDNTASAWKARFGVPYSVCGCMPDPPPKAKSSNPLKGTNPLKSSKSPDSKSKFSLFRRSASSKGTVPAYTAEAEPRGDLVSSDLMWADASHPSEHNLYLEKPDGSEVQSDLISRELASKERTQTIKKDLERVESKATNVSESGTSAGSSEVAVDKWRKLQAERKEGRSEHGEAFTKKEGVNGVYYPYWGVSAYVPNGFFGAVKYEDAVGGCASGSGSGCASGMNASTPSWS